MHLLRRSLRVEQFVQHVGFVQLFESIGVVAIIVVELVVVAIQPVQFVAVESIAFVWLIVVAIVVGVVEQRVVVVIQSIVGFGFRIVGIQSIGIIGVSIGVKCVVVVVIGVSVVFVGVIVRKFHLPGRGYFHLV